MSKKRLEELDSLRGIAALAVACFHYTETTNLSGHLFYFASAVDLFFMISGFVIFLSIKQTATARDFSIKRILRLYPTYWLCVILTTLFIILNHFYLATPGRLPIRFIVNMTMLQHFLHVTDIDGPYWTLAVELMFYILIIGLKRFRLIDQIELLGNLFLLAPLTLDFLIFPLNKELYHAIDWYLPLINHWPTFFAGILLYKCMSEKTTFKRALSIAFCFIIALAISGKASKMGISVNAYFVIYSLYFLAMIGLINGKLKFLKVKPLLFMGTISYAFYLIHQYVGLHFIIKNAQYNVYTAILISFIISTLLATIITKYLEPKFRRQLEKILK